MVNILPLDKLKVLAELSKKQFPKEKDCYEFLMFEIQKHLVEINNLKEEKDSHAIEETIDLSILTRMLALQEGANKELFEKRYKRFREKAANS